MQNFRLQNALHCNTLQQAATHCVTLHHTATHRKTLQYTATRLPARMQNLTLQNVHMLDVTHSYVWHDSRGEWHDTFTCVPWLSESCHTYEWIMSHMRKSHVTTINAVCRWLALDSLSLSLSLSLTHTHTYTHTHTLSLSLSLALCLSLSLSLFLSVTLSLSLSLSLVLYLSYVANINEVCGWLAFHSFTCVTRLIYMCNTSQSYDICVTWLLHVLMIGIGPTNQQYQTHEGVMSHIWHMTATCDTYKWVTSHLWKSRVTTMNAVCGWFALHRRISNVQHMNESCHTCECDVLHIWINHFTQVSVLGPSQIWMIHVTRMKESRHKYERVTSHVRNSHVTHVKEPCQTFELVTSHRWEYLVEGAQDHLSTRMYVSRTRFHSRTV